MAAARECKEADDRRGPPESAGTSLRVHAGTVRTGANVAATPAERGLDQATVTPRTSTRRAAGVIVAPSERAASYP